MGTSVYSSNIIAGARRSGEDSIVVRAGVRIGIAVRLGRGVGIPLGVAITGEYSIISHCSKHSHLSAEVVATVTSDDGAGERHEGGLIAAVGVAATIWRVGVRGGVIARSPMLFEAYKFECEDTIEPTTRRIKRITGSPVTNRFFSGSCQCMPSKDVTSQHN